MTIGAYGSATTYANTAKFNGTTGTKIDTGINHTKNTLKAIGKGVVTVAGTTATLAGVGYCANKVQNSAQKGLLKKAVDYCAKEGTIGKKVCDSVAKMSKRIGNSVCKKGGIVEKVLDNPIVKGLTKTKVGKAALLIGTFGLTIAGAKIIKDHAYEAGKIEQEHENRVEMQRVFNG